MSTAEPDGFFSPSLRRAPVMRGAPRRRAIERDLPASACDEVAKLFPAARPCDDGLAFPARRSARELDGVASASTWIISEGLKALAPAERLRVRDGWRTQRRDSVSTLVTDGGCDVRIGHDAATGALRLALLTWLPLTRSDFAVYEGGLFEYAPAKSITLLVRPPTIWPFGEALAAARRVPQGHPFDRARLENLDLHARGRVRSSHRARLREAAARIRIQLPFAGFPVASAIVAAGCDVIASDDDWCTVIAARQLARYASSAFVGRRTPRTVRRPLPRTPPGLLGHPAAPRGAS